MKRSKFRIAEIWRSVISWMRWRRRARTRALEDQRHQLEMFGHLLTADVSKLLLDALRPVALAMQAQDALTRHEAERTREALVQTHSMLEEMLEEVLNTVQPNPDTEIRSRVGLYRPTSSPPSSSLSSVISATRSSRTS